MSEGTSTTVEPTPAVVGPDGLALAQSVLMTVVSAVGVLMWGKQAYTGISARIGK